MNSVIVYPINHPISSILQIPGDKSVSHRALLFSAISEGTTTIHQLLESEDVLCTAQALRELGVKIEKSGKDWIVEGVGLNGLRPPSRTLYCGNSGTTLRLMMGILAGQPFTTALTGDSSLNKRPVKRVTEPLTQMGAAFEIEGDQTNSRVIHVKGKKLRGISYSSPIASAQVKSAVLLAGLWAEGITEFTEPTLSRDHTERMLQASGVALTQNGSKTTLASSPDKITFPAQFTVPADISSAAFFIIAATLVANSELTLKKIGLNPTRTGLLDILKKMGGKFSISNQILEAGEEVGDITVYGSSLLGSEISGEIIPRLIDEIPILSIAASQAIGFTAIRDANELRVKESDRIKTIVNMLTNIGGKVQELEDGLLIEWGSTFKTGTVKSLGDHRIAMSAIIAGLITQGEITIEDIDCINTSFPEFFNLFKQIGGKFKVISN